MVSKKYYVIDMYFLSITYYFAMNQKYMYKNISINGDYLWLREANRPHRRQIRHGHVTLETNQTRTCHFRDKSDKDMSL